MAKLLNPSYDGPDEILEQSVGITDGVTITDRREFISGLEVYRIPNPTGAGTFGIDERKSLYGGQAAFADTALTGHGVRIWSITDNTELRTINNPTSNTSDGFAQKVVLGGGNLMITAPFWNSSTGRVYIYSITTGKQKFILEKPSGAANDQWGLKADFDGRTVAVFCKVANILYLYDIKTGALKHSVSIPAPETGQGDVRIFGMYAAVGMGQASSGGFQQAGRIHIVNVNTGTIERELTCSGTLNDVTLDPYYLRRLGFSFDLDGKYLISYVNKSYDNGTYSGGTVIFDVTTGNVINAIPNPFEGSSLNYTFFGDGGISLSGTYAAIPLAATTQAPGVDANEQYTGRVYLFNILTGEEVACLRHPTNGGASNFFYKNPQIFGNYVICASWDSSTGGQGTIYIFTVDTFLNYLTNTTALLARAQGLDVPV